LLAPSEDKEKFFEQKKILVEYFENLENAPKQGTNNVCQECQIDPTVDDKTKGRRYPHQKYIRHLLSTYHTTREQLLRLGKDFIDGKGK